jgi:hypothetical protein
MPDMVERRRTPRAELMVNEVCRLELRHRVQLLDISQSGALLGADTPVPVGSRGQFRAGLAALPFNAEVLVKRHQSRTAKNRVALGMQFATMDDRSRNSLDQFLRRAKE